MISLVNMGRLSPLWFVVVDKMQRMCQKAITMVRQYTPYCNLCTVRALLSLVDNITGIEFLKPQPPSRQDKFS